MIDHSLSVYQYSIGDGPHRWRAGVQVQTSWTSTDQWGNVVSYQLYRPRVVVQVAGFPVLKRTARGAWIESDGERRFVLDGPGKRYAHETPELAIESLMRRQLRRVKILRGQLEGSEIAVAALRGLHLK